MVAGNGVQLHTRKTPQMIEVSSAQYTYPGQRTPAVAGVNLAVREGEVVSLIGRNASGKSTLGKLLAGILTPSGGRVTVDGIETGEEAARYAVRRRVAFLQQNPESQFVSVTVEREIAAGPENLGFPPEQTRSVVGDMLELFGLLELRRSPPSALSAGQMQKVLLAALLAMKPAYLILDEPTSYLDPLERKAVGEELKSICCSTGTSMVWVTQFPAEAFSFRRVVAMDAGRICFDGSPDVLLASDGLKTQLGLQGGAACRRS